MRLPPATVPHRPAAATYHPLLTPAARCVLTILNARACYRPAARDRPPLPYNRPHALTSRDREGADGRGNRTTACSRARLVARATPLTLTRAVRDLHVTL